jgi:hypothetical protein
VDNYPVADLDAIPFLIFLQPIRDIGVNAGNRRQGGHGLSKRVLLQRAAIQAYFAQFIHKLCA